MCTTELVHEYACILAVDTHYYTRLRYLRYRISFPLFASSSVVGSNKQAVYEFLTNSSAYPAMRGEVRWNFEKFLVDRQGQVIARYPSAVAPNHPQLLNDIEKLL